jgi:hypothetical protein
MSSSGDESEAEPEPRLASREKRGRSESVDESSSEGEVESDLDPVPIKKRRVSIFPGSLAYNDAILVSFETVELSDLAHPHADTESSRDESSSHSSSSGIS